jgi:hypothetical protein
VDRGTLLRVHRTALIDGVAEEVEDAAEDFLADRHADRGAGVDAGVATLQTVGRREGDAADLAAAEVTGNLTEEAGRLTTHLEVDGDGVVDLRKRVLGELGVEGRADDLANRSGGWHGWSPLGVIAPPVPPVEGLLRASTRRQVGREHARPPSEAEGRLRRGGRIAKTGTPAKVRGAVNTAPEGRWRAESQRREGAAKRARTGPKSGGAIDRLAEGDGGRDFDPVGRAGVHRKGASGGLGRGGLARVSAHGNAAGDEAIGPN